VIGELVAHVAGAVDGDEPRAVRAGRAARVIREATSARWVGIYTVSRRGVSIEAWSGPGAPAHPTFPATEGLTSHAIRSQRPIVSNDVAHDPRYLANQDDSGSELIVPVLAEGQVVGTLDVESERTGAFDAAAVREYEQLAEALRSFWATRKTEA
jgi:L-methionine (R)-S-oxide reductase